MALSEDLVGQLSEPSWHFRRGALGNNTNNSQGNAFFVSLSHCIVGFAPWTSGYLWGSSKKNLNDNAVTRDLDFLGPSFPLFKPHLWSAGVQVSPSFLSTLPI